MNKIEQMIENMSEADLQAILNTEFPEEMEKQAAVAVAEGELADALYAYGAMVADREFSELSLAEGQELSKEASEGFSAAETELSALIDSGVSELGYAESEDAEELHKTAQAAAAVILEGYTDQLEKIAEEKAKVGMLTHVKNALMKKYHAAKGHAQAAGGYLKKHHKPILGGAAVGALGAVGALKAKEKLEKKSSEMTAGEMLELMNESANEQMLVADGIEKLANMGEAKAAKGVFAKVKEHAQTLGHKLKGAGTAAKEKAEAAGKYLKHNVKPIAGGMAVGGALGAGGMHLHKKHKKD